MQQQNKAINLTFCKIEFKENISFQNTCQTFQNKWTDAYANMVNNFGEGIPLFSLCGKQGK